MFSGIFIDRPRFAIVIAIVITLAGVIAMRAIPIGKRSLIFILLPVAPPLLMIVALRVPIRALLLGLAKALM